MFAVTTTQWIDTGNTRDKPAEVFFDTGPSAHSYPSIAGRHNGTIRANETLTVHKLYTYPCVGTAGHSEYAAISYYGTLIAEAYWNGYTGDWHNITFNNSFTLYANETYNYTIRTGSYPQIHHTNLLNIPNGAGYSDAVHFNTLIEYLPEAPSGWAGEEPFGQTFTTAEGTWSMAMKSYMKSDNEELTADVGIMDSAYQQVGWMAAWQGFYAYESIDGYAKTATVEGYPAWVAYTKDDNQYVLYVNINDRFMVFVNTNSDRDTLYDFADGIDYTGIAALSTGAIEAPPFTLNSIDGATFSLSDFCGKVVVLTLIMTPCYLSQNEMAELVQLREAYPEVVVISVSIDPLETDEKLRSFKEAYNADWLFARDTDDIASRYQGYVLATPTIVVITPQGCISFREVGFVSLEDLKSAIESVYQGGVITCSEFVDVNGKRHEGWIPAIRLS